ncbi:HTH-type transcriptional regulator [Pandoraea morbifera]|uniref:HTH-type transcriptional regulator n=2 Tax=Pandoraea morbifera TaxID=2508300 RepID=A0A5E4W2H7_9BURK|nr:HTH-type transcriptional regulator [Pandoraea morbifera]
MLNIKVLTLVFELPIVRHMANQSIPLDRIFQALSDPTRRAVVERLTLGPASVSELARPFSMALPSFSQHLNVLEESGLVVSRKTGRVRTYALETETLAGAQDWLQLQRDKWTRRLDQLDSYLLQMKET